MDSSVGRGKRVRSGSLSRAPDDPRRRRLAPIAPASPAGLATRVSGHPMAGRGGVLPVGAAPLDAAQQALIDQDVGDRMTASGLTVSNLQADHVHPQLAAALLASDTLPADLHALIPGSSPEPGGYRPYRVVRPAPEATLQVGPFRKRGGSSELSTTDDRLAVLIAWKGRVEVLCNRSGLAWAQVLARMGDHPDLVVIDDAQAALIANGVDSKLAATYGDLVRDFHRWRHGRRGSTRGLAEIIDELAMSALPAEEDDELVDFVVATTGSLYKHRVFAAVDAFVLGAVPTGHAVSGPITARLIAGFSGEDKSAGAQRLIGHMLLYELWRCRRRRQLPSANIPDIAMLVAILELFPERRADELASLRAFCRSGARSSQAIAAAVTALTDSDMKNDADQRSLALHDLDLVAEQSLIEFEPDPVRA